MNISTFKGEDVSTATGRLRMAIKQLIILNKVSVEVDRRVVEVMQTSFVSKFNMFFSQLQINIKQIPSLQITTNKILSLVDSQ